jgi:hypothetical protein
MSGIFTATEIEVLSAEIDRQLQELKESRRMEIINHSLDQFKGGYREKESFQDKESFRRDETNTQELIKQKESIELVTKEPMESFLAKFGQAAKSDLCDKDGLLHKQWEKYGDLSIKDALEVVGKILIQQMSFTTDNVSKLVVPIIVVILHFKLKAFCKDYGSSK